MYDRFSLNFLILALFLPILSSLSAQNHLDFPASGKTTETIIGKDWKILDQKFADFNMDQREDAIYALEYSGREENRIGERQLLILFQEGNGYKYILSSKSALLGKNDGGIFGDPFSEIKIKKNTFIISHYGGSAWRWGSDVQFRYDHEQWVLIGKKVYGYFNGINCEKLNDFSSTKITDINYLTGDRYDKEISDSCELKIDKRSKQKKLPLKSLKNFDIQKDT